MTVLDQPAQQPEAAKTVPENGDPAAEEIGIGAAGALQILRRGIQQSPALHRGLWVTALMGLSIAAGRLVIPALIQRTIDQGRLAESGSVNLDAVFGLVGLAVVVILASAVMGWQTQRRLVSRAEEAIAQLRVDAFTKVHQMSIADHNDTKRGVLVSRVTSDVEALALFVNWGLYSWVINPVMLLGTLAVMAAYSVPLAALVTVIFFPALPVMRYIQRRQLAANDVYRTAVGDMLGSFSEVVSGAPVIRAYGAQGRSAHALSTSIRRRYHSRLKANRYTALVFIVSDFFAAFAFGVVLVVGVRYRDQLGLDAGELVAILFLVTLLAGPISEISETLDQTQSAVSAWRKILDLLDHPADVVELTPGLPEVPGPVEIDVRDITFAYRGAPPVITSLSVVIPAGRNVAVVGETGSGKTTFAKLLCRLADPTSGEIRLNGVPLDQLGPDARHRSVRMVPQDGFLFDTTIGRNIRFGRPNASDSDIQAAIDRLGLKWWVDRLPLGLDTPVGERGESLSVGERQLVALIRAALADPGLLILDEATSAVDPETDAALTSAIHVLAEGRTLVSVAHRLATAEAADLVMVFDAGVLVEMGPHRQLVRQGGSYARLHAAWVGNTMTS